MHMNLVAILDGTKTLENLLDQHWMYEFDSYRVGGRLSEFFDVRIDGNPKLRLECGIAKVSDIECVDPKKVTAVLTPDGVWHDGFDYRTSQCIWEPDFKELFLDPYPDCVAGAVDYHV